MTNLYPPDISGLPPADRFAAEAERLADPVMAQQYRTLAKTMMASHEQLLGFLQAGTAYKLSDGTIVAGTNNAQVNAAVLSAKAAAGKGGPCDDPRFRRWLTGRSRDLGLNSPEFSVPDSTGSAGKSAMPGTLMLKMLGNGRVGIDVGGAVRQALAKARPSSRQLPETDAGRAYVESRRYSDLAAKAVDPETRELWLTAARQVRKEAGLA